MMRPFTVACALLAATLWSCTDDRDSLAGDALDDSTTGPDPVHDPDADLDPVPDPDPDPDPDPEPEPESECGDGRIEGDEVCDGGVFSCTSVDPAYLTGTAGCLPDCTDHDVTECLTYDDVAELIRRAAEITGEAHVDIMGLSLVGMYEWEVKEVVDAAFVEHGSDSLHAFSHIIGSGPNALELHYPGGGRMIEDGDLVVVDIGARYLGYCGDITRTYPANGVFSTRQREIYQLVLDTQTAVADAWRPGVHSLDDMYFFTVDQFRASTLRALDEFGVEQTMDAFFPHHIGHYIGTHVHGDDLWLDPAMPAQVGHVFAIEPGLYIASEGIGIRIEDVYVLTATGAVNLAPDTPKTIEDIEAWMAGTLP